MVDAATGNGSPPRWIRVEHAGTIGFGTWTRDAIRVFAGDMFARSTPASQPLRLKQVRRLTPTQGGKIMFEGAHSIVSGQTQANLVNICQYPLMRQITANLMSAAQSMVSKLGIESRVTLKKTHGQVRMQQTG